MWKWQKFRSRYKHKKLQTKTDAEAMWKWPKVEFAFFLFCKFKSENGMMPTHLAGREFCKFLSISLQHLAPGAGARGSQGCPSMIRFDKYIKKFKSALLVGYINILIIMVMILVLSPLMIYYTNTRILFWESFISCPTCLDQKLNTIQWKLSSQWCPVAFSTDRLSPPTPEIF